MKVHVPNSAFLGNIESFVRAFDPENPTELEITFNEKWSSVHPAVMSAIAAIVEETRRAKGHVTAQEPVAKSKHYLDVMELTPLLGMKTSKISKHEPTGRFIPLTQVRNSDELDKFIKNIVPLLHTNPETAKPIQYVISELVRNVLEHARSPGGAFVCAQYYKASKRVAIGVADRGTGVYNTIRVSHKPQNDLEAIFLALTPGITGTTKRPGGTSTNAGAGLFFTKSIAKTNRDFFLIYSGNALFKLLKTSREEETKLYADPKEDRATTYQDLPFWQGTVIGIDISTEEAEQFSKLLESIRNTYYTDVQKEKKQAFKPRFE